MSIYAAMILKYGLKDGQREHDIVFVDASSKEEAIETLQKHQWDNPLWLKSSKLAILKIVEADNIPLSMLIKNKSTTKKKIRVRMRKK